MDAVAGRNRGHRLKPWLRALLLLPTVLAMPVLANSSLTIVTTHPPEETAQLLASFRQQHPAMQVLLINRRAELIVQAVESGSLQGADIILSSSPFLLQTLRQRGLLQKLPVQSPASRCAPDGLLLADPQGRFASYGLAGFGIVSSRQGGRAAVRNWQDLLAPEFRGQLAISTPSRSGSTHLMVEKILQDEGWDKGWQLLLQLAGQQGQLAGRSFAVSRQLLEGSAQAGPMLDNAARLLLSQRPDLQFSYLPQFNVLPSYVALLQRARNQQEGKSFVGYLFSERGQQELLGSSRFKMPLNPLSADAHSQVLCQLMRRQRILDEPLMHAREQLVKTLYDLLITSHFAQLRDSWGLWQLAAAQKNLDSAARQKLARAKWLLGTPPVNARSAANPQLLQTFARDDAQSRLLLQQWSARWQQQLDEAARLSRRLVVEAKP